MARGDLSTRTGARAQSQARWFAGCCLSSGVVYALWLLSPGINPHLDLLNGYVSELSARDQPGSMLFRAADAIAGLFAVAAALLGMRAHRGRWALVGWVGLLVFGAATAIDVTLTPMECATFIDSGCAVRELVGALPLTHELHTITSSLAGAGALVAMAGLGLAARGTTGFGLPPRAAWAWFGVTGLATVATLVALLAGSWAGVTQRIQLIGVSTWLIALALAELRRPRREWTR